MSKILLRVLFFLIFLVRCAGAGDAPSSVLEPVTEDDAAPPAAVEAPPPAPKPADRLLEKLRALGYKGLGMEFEDPSTLTFLEKVFDTPEAKSLDVKHVYTGMRMEYDGVQKSLTLGGTRDIKAVLNFLKKKVPRLPAN